MKDRSKFGATLAPALIAAGCVLAGAPGFAHADPPANEPGWGAVELKTAVPLPHPVTLEQIKADPAFAKIELIRQSRLSVSPLTRAEFDRILKLGA